MRQPQVSEVVEPGATLVLPVDGVVDFAAGRATVAARQAARAVSHLEPPLQVCWRTVRPAVDIEHRAGDRVGEDSRERGSDGGEPARGVGVDRPVTVEEARIL